MHKIAWEWNRPTLFKYFLVSTALFCFGQSHTPVKTLYSVHNIYLEGFEHSLTTYSFFLLEQHSEVVFVPKHKNETEKKYTVPKETLRWQHILVKEITQKNKETFTA